MPPDFRDWWTSRFGDVAPIGWRLRERFPDRWLRLHTLPGSKRYADTEDETREILRRQEALAAEVLRVGAPCWIAVPTFEGERASPPPLPAFPGLAFEPAHVDDEGSTTSVAVTRARWTPGAHEPARRAIAEDALRAVWVSLETAEIFAPYDGGVDLVVAEASRREALRGKHAAWLSPRADGL